MLLILQENHKVLIFLKVYCGLDSQQDYVRIGYELGRLKITNKYVKLDIDGL